MFFSKYARRYAKAFKKRQTSRNGTEFRFIAIIAVRWYRFIAKSGKWLKAAWIRCPSRLKILKQESPIWIVPNRGFLYDG